MATDVKELMAKVGKIRILTNKLIDDQLAGIPFPAGSGPRQGTGTSSSMPSMSLSLVTPSASAS